jgi:hypothetical protein
MSKVSTVILEPEKLIDRIADRVATILGRAIVLRKIRKSQVLTAVVGAAGFALFTAGVVKMTENLPGWASVVLGFLLMALSGFLLRNLWR